LQDFAVGQGGVREVEEDLKIHSNDPRKVTYAILSITSSYCLGKTGATTLYALHNAPGLSSHRTSSTHFTIERLIRVCASE
jgi:hypothetical protein